MELHLSEQIDEYVKKSSRILIALPRIPTLDALASGAALKLILETLGKRADAVTAGPVPEHARFLPGVEAVKHEIGEGVFVISLDVSERPLEEISYHTEDGKVNIFVKAKEGGYTADDVSFSSPAGAYDLVFTIGAAALDDLGEVFTDHADMLYGAPKINIDRQASNEYFGNVNLVDVTATSLAEVVYELVMQEGYTLTPDIATSLLAGIVVSTNSFQGVQTTPKAFAHAAELVAHGARQQEIIQHIFKTKSYALLRLWGRALARLKTHREEESVYSVLNVSDFEKTETTEGELPLVLREFIDHMAGFKIFGLLAELPKGGIRLLLAAHPQVSVKAVLERLGATMSAPKQWGMFSIVDSALNAPDLATAETRYIEALAALEPQGAAEA